MKLFSRVVHFLTVGLISSLLLFSIFLAVLQTKWGQKKLRESLSAALSQEGFYVQMDNIEGRLPFDVRIDGLKIKLPFGQEIFAPHVKLRLELFPLLRKEIAVSYVYARKVNLVFTKVEKPPSFDINFPLTLSFKSLKIPHLKLEKDNKTLLLSLSGSGKIKRNFKEIIFDLKAQTEANKVDLIGYTNKAMGSGKFMVRADVENLKEFDPFYNFGFELNGNLEASLEGTLNSWVDLLKNKKGNSLPLEGHLNANLCSFKLDNYETPLESKLTFFVFSDHSIHLSKAHLENELIKIDGAALFNNLMDVKSIDLGFKMPEVKSLVPLEGSVEGIFHYDPLSSKLELKAYELLLGNQIYHNLSATFLSLFENHEWNGNFSILAAHPLTPLEAKGLFLFKPHISLSLPVIELYSLNNQVNGSLEYQFSPKILEGDLFAQIVKLEQFQQLFPSISLKGKLGAKIHFFQDDREHLQAADINASLKEGSIWDFSAQEFLINAKLVDIFGSPKGQINIDGQNIHYSHLELFSFCVKSYFEDHQWPYEISVKGKGKDHFELTSKGSLQFDTQKNRLGVNEFSGFALKKPFNLEKPLEIEWGKNQFSLTDLELKLGGGDLFFSFSNSVQELKGEIKAEHIPLNILTLYYPSFSLNGFTSFEGNFQVVENRASGRLNLLLEKTEISGLGRQNELNAKGSLLAFLDQNTLQLYAQVNEREGEFLESKATLPIIFTPPLKFSIDNAKDLSAELKIDGRIEDIFDFINIGSHRLTGTLLTHLHLSKTLQSPGLGGSIELFDGSYENYYTATHLKEIKAKALASNHEIKLLNLEAKDEKEGFLKASGLLDLDSNKKFPYKIEADLTNLTALNFESITANFTGPLEITGNSKQAIAKGNLVVEKAEVEIPDSLPTDVPILPITFLNKPPEHSQTIPSSIFPFNLDVQITAPEKLPGKILVRGRGLRSEWKGDAHLKGSNTQIAAGGAFTLLRGEFVFSGKVFDLREGEITLIDKPTQDAHINLKGTLTLPELTITALMNGPISSPVLTFQSSPHLPTSSILAHILFNKDISEISPIQAIQLAQMIVTLSGKMGPDVLETIRRSLGVDRLNIVSCYNQEGEDRVNLQIGKYLTKGVMVTLSQGTDSTQVIVEAELSRGFTLQAETEPDQQGKFSLKWHKNY